MANFARGDATFEKPYLNMLVEQIETGTAIKFGGSASAEKIKITADIKKFITAVKSGRWTDVSKVIYPSSQWAPIFNGKKWTQIDKAPFSGQGGSGAGAEMTALVECLQCYVSAYQFNIKKGALTPKDLTKTNLKSAEKYVKADRTLDQCLKKGPKDWMDGGVYVLIANKIYSKYRSRFSGTVYFHRGSPFMNKLYEAKAVCHKSDRESASPQAPGSFANDKWNPGDIWATTLGVQDDPLGAYTGTWETLNKQVAKLAGAFTTSGAIKLLGISLKKTTAPSITVYRDPQAKPKNQISYDGFIFGKNGDFFSSQDMYLHSNAGEVQFRTFSGDKSWQGEIKGKMAAGGKIGGGNVDFYTQKYLKKNIFTSSGESGLLSEVSKSSEAFLKKFYKLYKETNGKQMVPAKTLSYDQFKAEVKNKDRKFLTSKYVCLILASMLVNATNPQRKNFTNAIFSYASSDTDQSSYYIKLS